LDMRKKRQQAKDIPPYIVPLSIQAMEIVRHLLDEFSEPRRVLQYRRARQLWRNWNQYSKGAMQIGSAARPKMNRAIRKNLAAHPPTDPRQIAREAFAS